jgi:hypothetical protein
MPQERVLQLPPVKPPRATSVSEHPLNGVIGLAESQMTKELKINIRNIHNIHKKLAASSKADAVIANNPDQTFGDLVASKTINAYQQGEERP